MNLAVCPSAKNVELSKWLLVSVRSARKLLGSIERQSLRPGRNITLRATPSSTMAGKQSPRSD